MRIPPPSLRAFLPRADCSPLLASCGTNCTSLQKFISHTRITKRITALTEYSAREEEFGTRARVLPLHKCTSALGTQIVAALRLRFRLRIRNVVFKRALSKCTLNRLRKKDVVLRRTRSECALTVSEMAAPLETSRSCTITIFCQGIALKNFACKASKNFRALDNDLPLKSKHARSGFPPRALITL